MQRSGRAAWDVGHGRLRSGHGSAPTGFAAGHPTSTAAYPSFVVKARSQLEYTFIISMVNGPLQ